MGEKDLQKILAALVIVCLVVVAGCTSSNTSSLVPTKTYSGNGITFKYPATWTVNETTYANGVQVYVGESSIKGVVIDKSSSGSLKEEVNSIISGSKQLGAYVSDKALKVNGLNAHEVITSPMTDRKILTVYVETKPGQIYSIGTVSTDSDFEQYKNNLYIIANSFKAQ